MSDSAILEKLEAVVRSILGDEDTPITLATTAADVPSWDSINHIYIVASTEAAFGVKFRAAELERLKNIGDFVALIGEKLK